MCVVCGCQGEGASVEAGTTVVSAKDGLGRDLHFGLGAAKVSVPGMSQERAIELEVNVLGANNKIAQENRAHFASHGVLALNLVSSPGSGKTTLLCATVQAMRQRDPQVAMAVIEGDQQTSNDADRIRATGIAAIQVNTGKGCHLDAPMVAAAFSRLDFHHHAHEHEHQHAHSHDEAHEHAQGHSHTHHEHDHDHPHTHEHDDPHGHKHQHAANKAAQSLLFIENVGNLVCPAMWDLGEAAKVAILSVTEGEDKPLKYPDMFAAAKLMILNKVDLLPYLKFDVVKCIDFARQVNPGIQVLLVSATTGQGMDAWLDWLQTSAVAQL